MRHLESLVIASLASLALLIAAPANADTASPQTGKGARVVSVPAAAGGEATPVDVSFSVDKAVYQSGEIPIIKVKPATACRVSLFYKDAEGKILQLFPNRFITDNRLEGGKEVQLLPAPNPLKQGDKVAIEIFGPPFGKEEFILVATAEPQGILAGKGAGGAGGSPFPNAVPKAARVVSRVTASAAAAPRITTSAPAAGPLRAEGKGTASLTITTKQKQ